MELGKEILDYATGLQIALKGSFDEEQALFEAWQTTAVELAVSSLKPLSLCHRNSIPRYNVLIKDPRTGAYKVNFAKESCFEGSETAFRRLFSAFKRASRSS